MKKALVLSAILVFAIGAFAGQQFSTKSFDVTFHEAVTAGTVQLPAGVYRARHVMEGDNHILVFSLQRGINGHHVDQREFRVNCRMEPLPSKADQTLKFYNTAPNGQRILTALIFAGDTNKHVF